MADPTAAPSHPLTALVVVGGDAPPGGLAGLLPDADVVICADSGLDHALGMGLAPSLVVGDLDSVSPEALERARRAGVSVEDHPADKDVTDTELAIEAALREGATRIILLGGGGGDRLDHTLGALHALAHPRLAGVPRLEAWWGTAHAVVLHGPATTELCTATGTLVSLVPLAGDAHGVSTRGLRWPLHDEQLLAAAGRGVSNEATDIRVTVEVRHGVVLVIRPGVLAPAHR